MFYAALNVSTRTLLKLTAVLLLLAGFTGSAFAANTGVAPQLVPYTVNLVAGNTTLQTVVGFGGDGQLGQNSTLSSPNVVAVDSVGNIYFPDGANAVIREINAQTGVINTVAGVIPTGCGGSTGTTCAATHTGCADGVPALANPISSNSGIAIDAYGNIYLADGGTQSISVIYRGGAQVAAFITLENPGGVTKAGGVLPGYIYHVAGTVSLTSCVGTKSASSTSTTAAVPAGDGNLAFNSGATFGGISTIALDSAGNLFVGDGSPNNVIRVINTQSTSQTYYGKTVLPGYIASVVDCGPLTILCPAGYGGSPSTLANTGVGGPAGGGVFNTFSTGNGQWMNVDAYGDVYELNTKNGTPGINLGVAYAGASPLATLINNALLVETGIAGATTLKAAAGDFYYILNSITLRPSSIAADVFGNLYYQDNHYGEVYRVDANAPGSTTNYLAYSTLFAASRNNPATTSALTYCYPVNFVANSTTPTLTGYQSYDAYGDGCPANQAQGPGATSTVSGYGTTITDGQGDLILADRTHNAIRNVLLNNKFPATKVGSTLQQSLQVHFDQSNLPVKTTLSPLTTAAFSIAPGIPDFTVSPISSQFTTSATPAVTSLPTCANVNGSADNSLDCTLNIIFAPTAPGVRQAELVVTTANGSVYSFGLTGIGTGGQLAIDGGAQAVLPVTGLGNTGQVAVGPTGTVYVADPSNNRVVATPGATSTGAQTTIGTGLKSPMGVAVDFAGNVYIADTGNNRILEVNPITGAQTLLGNIVAAGTYTNYAFKAPQALAVDANQNVYVADTGNAAVVEIPANFALGGATPLLQYAGAPKFVSPVGIAVDQVGNIYVADTGLNQIAELPAGGGDLQNLPGTTLAPFQSSAVSHGVFKSPSSIAVDGAGNIYVTDISSNTGGDEVVEVPSNTGPGSEKTALNFTNLNVSGSSPAVSAYRGGAVALDANGNLYVSDSGNSRVLFDNRQNPTVAYGTVPQNQPPAVATLTVTNIGSQPVTIASPFAAVASVSPAGNTAFTIPAATNTCTSSTTLLAGLHCSFVTSFVPTSDGPQGAMVSVNGTAQTVMLTANGEQPLVKIVLAVSSPASGPVAGQPATVTATLTQPFLPGVTPSGTVTFTYLIQGDGTTGTVTSPVTGAGGTSTATLTLPTLLQGRRYTINATYNGDAQDSTTVATPLVFYIPGIPVTVTANSVTYVYGQPVPAISGTVTGITDSAVTYKFVTAATPSTPIGTYPITVVFSGGSYLNYGFPPTLTPGGQAAVVTETAATLKVAANNATTQYGAANLSYTSTLTGVVNNDGFAETYTPPSSSILNVGLYPLVPTLIGNATGNYTVTVTNGTLTVTTASTNISVSEVAPSVLPTALSTDPITISVATAVAAGKGTPTGTVTITDTFTPITTGAPGTGPTAAPATIGPLALVAGTVTYTPTSTTVGTHSYTVAYSGDTNFAPSTTLSPTTLLVDNQDFLVSAPTTPIQVAPGVLPGGNAAVAGEAAATPQTATVTVTSILSFTGVVTLTCQPQNPSYVTCAMTPPTVTVPKPTTGTSNTITSVFSVQTPATLPLNFQFSELQNWKTGSKAVWAFLPLGALAFCFRKRKRLSKALWMLLAMGAISVGMTGCGANSVHYYTPVPAGAQTVTIFATGISPTTNTSVTRSFTVSINIQ